MKLKELLEVNSDDQLEIECDHIGRIYYGKDHGDKYEEMLKKYGEYEVDYFCGMGMDDYGIYISIKEK